MALKKTTLARLPEGKHNGVITNAEETTRTFDPQKGPEEVVEVTIQPGWTNDDGHHAPAVSVTFTPVLNGLSALDSLLERLGQTPDDGAEWEPKSLIGTEVSFVAVHSGNFTNVKKDSITAQ